MSDSKDQIRSALKGRKFFTILQLVGWLHVSVPTARRRLKQWGTHTSYNKNGRYYTLSEIPRFDKHGLWRSRGVFFSRHGNLVQTVVQLVYGSNAGYTGEELGKLLGMQARSFLANFRHRSELAREKIAGRYVWFSADEQVRGEQRHMRLTRSASQARQLPADADAVVILAELISAPQSTPLALARRLALRGLNVTAQQIENLLVCHDLVKKTADSPSC